MADEPPFNSLPTPYYDDGRVTIYHGDAFELTAEVVEHVAAVVTDPPYGVGKEYGVGTVDDDDLVKRIATDLVPIMRRAPAVAITPGTRNLYNYPRPDHVMVWVHSIGNGSWCSWGLNGWQPILCYGRDPYRARGLTMRNDVLVHNMAGRGQEKLERLSDGHPAPGPFAISKWLVERLGPEVDDWILDPFMGTGSFVAAAKHAGRRAIGIDINERWCEVAARRVSQGMLDLEWMGTDA